ncbi:MAG TPA: NAD-dependent DNA ligase LigA [Chloroflexota bacterium]|nr:NAD-dependent DNA ligase LigA [Chloroflexota bacterium]
MLAVQGQAVAARVAAILNGAPAEPVEIDELLSAADTAYYDEDAPLIDDAAYDQLTELAKRLTGQAHQVLGEVSTELVAVPHAYPTLSLQKAYSADELRDFKVSAARTLGIEGGPDALTLSIEPKLDGLTLVLQYSGGTLVRALTRGNGKIGEDVTHNVRGLSGVPEAIPEREVTVYIRGEAYLPLSRFAALQAAGEDVATARNTAAGDLRRKSGAQSTAAGGISRARAHGITFLAYSIEGEGLGDRFPTQPDVDAALAEWGFTVPEYRLASEGPAADERFEAPVTETGRAIADLLDTLAGADFGTDGLVLKVAGRAWQRRLGASEKTPRWAIAYKRLGAEYETTVRAVQWQVGRVGQVTPVLIADAVDMDGAQVTHYTAHHAAFYRALGAGTDARIVVTRAGDVIPKVLRLAPGQEPDPDLPIPDRCPSCEAPLVLRSSKVLECHNAACPPKLRKSLDYFAARDNMDIEGLGKEVIEALVSNGHVHAPADLYRLAVEELTALPLANGQLYGATRAAKLAAAIDASRAKPFSTVLHALGAPGVGYPECRMIAQYYGLADLLARCGEADCPLRDELTALHSIGPATATAFTTFLAENAAWISQLPAAGLQVERESAPQAVDGPLSGKTFVVTGSLEMGSREDVEAWIRAHGGTISSSVSSHTTYLVAGVKPGGSKVKAAAKHGVPTLGEVELHALVQEYATAAITGPDQ